MGYSVPLAKKDSLPPDMEKEDVILEIVKVLMKEEQIACVVSKTTLIQIDNVFLELVLKWAALNAEGMGA